MRVGKSTAISFLIFAFLYHFEAYTVLFYSLTFYRRYPGQGLFYGLQREPKRIGLFTRLDYLRIYTVIPFLPVVEFKRVLLWRQNSNQNIVKVFVMYLKQNKVMLPTLTVANITFSYKLMVFE